MEKENENPLKKLYLVFQSKEPIALEDGFKKVSLDSEEELFEAKGYANKIAPPESIICEIEIDDQIAQIDLFEKSSKNGSRVWIGKQAEGEATKLGFSIRVNVTEIKSQKLGLYNYGFTATLSPYSPPKQLKAPDPLFLPSQRRKAS